VLSNKTNDVIAQFIAVVEFFEATVLVSAKRSRSHQTEPS
jgi:hypothetical protein